jgi:hypothetical protein
MTIQQMIEIPADRRLIVDLPMDVPVGAARLKLSISGKAKGPDKPVKMSRQMRKMMRFYGCLKDSPAFEGDSVEIVRKLRDEWDSPWDKGNGQA